MAQANYTPISLYYSTTASAVPLNTNLVDGELAINITDGKLYYKNNSGVVTLLASSTATGGSFTSITDSGNLTFTGTGNRITGDFSNATVANRIAFQTSTTNGNSFVNVIPNGTGTSGGFIVYSTSDLSNAAFFTHQIVGGSDARFNSSITGTGTYLPMTFYTGGSERVRILTDGKVGIGTSSPVVNLDVNSEIAARPSTTADSAGFSALASDYLTSNTGTQIIQYGSTATGTTSGLSNASLGMLIFSNVSAGLIDSSLDIVFATIGAERMRLTNTGLGIGTTAPSTQLDVVTTINSSAQQISARNLSSGSSASSIINVGNDTAANALDIGVLSSTNTFFGGANSAQIQANNGNMFFGTSGAYATQFVTSGLERMRITSSGNIVAGSGEASATPVGNVIRAPNATGTNIAGANLVMYAGDGTGTGGSGYIDFQVAPVGSSGSTANTLASAMRITNAGYVGIGTASPTAKLEVSGSAKATNMSLNGVAIGDYSLYSGMVTRVSNGGGIGINSANSTDNAYIYFGSGTTSGAQQSAAIGRIGGDVLALFTASTERMRITSSGNIIAGSGEASATPVGNPVRAPNATGTNITGGNLSLYAGNGTGTGGSGYIDFQIATAGLSGSTANTLASAMRIANNGNVGVGTTTLTNKFNVAGAIQSSSALAAIDASTVAISQESGYSRLAAFGPNTSTGGTLYLYSISSNGSVQNGAIIDSSGNVLIGQTAQTWDELLGAKKTTTTGVVAGFYASSGAYTSTVVRAQAENATGTAFYLFEGRGNVGGVKFTVDGAGNGYYAGNMGIGVTPTSANALEIKAGTASVAPIKLTSGTNLTSAVAGAVEYDGVRFYETTDTTSGRGYVPSAQIFRLSANGAAIGPTIAGFFGANSAINLAASGSYELEAYLYFTKTTAGTLILTMNFSTAMLNLNGTMSYGGAAGGSAFATTNQSTLFAASGSLASFSTTASLTTAVNHVVMVRAVFDSAASASNMRIQVTLSAGTVTPLRNSYYKITRLPASNTGSFAA